MTEFGRLLEQELPGLRRYARALAGDATRAEDLVQDCLERALRKAHLFQEGTNLRAWLFRMLHNVHANAARRFTTRPAHVSLEDAGFHASVGPGQTSSVELNTLLEALGHLPQAQREVLLLVGMEQMHYEEVAQVLEIPIGTVMSRLSRARERLRELLAETRAPGRRAQ